MSLAGKIEKGLIEEDPYQEKCPSRFFVATPLPDENKNDRHNTRFLPAAVKPSGHRVIVVVVVVVVGGGELY